MDAQLYKTHVDMIKLMAEISKKMPKNADVYDKITYDNLDSYKQDIEDWQDGRIAALDIYLPDWTELIRVYDDVMVDSHITAIVEVIKDKIKAKPFEIVDSNGEVNEEKTEMFQAEWFFKFLDICVETIYYPYSIIQLGDVEDDQFKELKLIKREYVVPQKKFIKQSLYVFGTYKNGKDGWDYTDPKLSPYFIELLCDYELGLLDKIAYHALGKKAMLIYWWRFGEIFGLPMRIGKTDISDPARRTNMENMMTNMGNSLSAVIDPQDEVMLAEAKASGTVSLFKDNLEYSNNEISKLLLGSSSVVDERSFVGSAEVGERIFEEKQKAICRKIAFIVQDKLIPRMLKYGFELNGYSFKWASEDTMKYSDKLEALKILPLHFDMDVEEVSEKTGFTLTEKEKISPENEIAKAIKAQSNLKELKALYNGTKSI